MMMRNKTGRFVTGLIVGSLTGAAVGLLLAPRSGRETREVVRHKTGHYVGTLRERFGRSWATNGAIEDATAAGGDPEKITDTEARLAEGGR